MSVGVYTMRLKVTLKKIETQAVPQSMVRSTGGTGIAAIDVNCLSIPVLSYCSGGISQPVQGNGADESRRSFCVNMACPGQPVELTATASCRRTQTATTSFVLMVARRCSDLKERSRDKNWAAYSRVFHFYTLGDLDSARRAQNGDLRLTHDHLLGWCLHLGFDLAYVQVWD